MCFIRRDLPLEVWTKQRQNLKVGTLPGVGLKVLHLIAIIGTSCFLLLMSWDIRWSDVVVVGFEAMRQPSH